jgi:glycosyltransferase involved in cell wall biosynthesis
LCYHKNPIYALEIFHEYLKQNPNSKFVYVGEGEYTKRIRKKIEELGIQDKVIMAGSVNDTYKWYQAFDLFLLPSLFEGLPVVLVEAQAAGLPAISSDTVTKQVDVTDIVKYKSIEESPEKWASEINNMILVEAERSKYKDWMMEAGFDIKSMAEQVQKYYLEANK